MKKFAIGAAILAVIGVIVSVFKKSHRNETAE